MKQCKLKKLESRLKNFIKRTLCHRNKNMPNKVCSFNELMECLRRIYKQTSTIVEYKQNVDDVKREAVGNLRLGDGKKCYGVYIIYCVCNTKENCEDLVKKGCGEVLYIGMSGTLGCNAQYKGQDVIGRIVNTKSRDIASKKWFENIRQECGRICMEITGSEGMSSKECFENISQQHGRICIEIICIDVVDDNNRTPQCKLLTPAVIEKLLLCCYLHERGKRPPFNLRL